jgi:hypothetical protein
MLSVSVRVGGFMAGLVSDMRRHLGGKFNSKEGAKREEVKRLGRVEISQN